MFEIVQDILYNKRGDVLDSTDAEASFVPYMLNRWISMYSDSNAILINETANVAWPIFKTKQEWYQFYLTVVPRSKFKKINYIKKTEKTSKTKKAQEEIDEIDLISKRFEFSKREAKMYIEFMKKEQ